MNKNLKYIFILSSLVYFTQGIGSLVSQPLFYYLKEILKIPIAKIAIITSITSLPWLIKPLYGILSDNFPLFGYRRKSYIILSSLLSVVSCLILGLTPFTTLYILFGLMIVDSLGGAIKDVAVDGVMVQEGKKYGIAGKIQSIQWTALTIASVLTGAVGGYIAEKFTYQTAYLAIIVFPTTIALFALGYKEEKVMPKKSSAKAIAKNYLTILKNPQLLLSAAFLFCMWFSPSLGTLTLGRYRDDLHFSKMWIGWLSTIGALSGVVGSLLYFKFGEQLKIKKWLLISALFNALSTFAYLYFTSHSVFIYTIVFNIAGMFMQLIVMNFMAKTCPEGAEATTFALLCSVLNLGSFLSGIVGGSLAHYVTYNTLVVIAGVSSLFCLSFIPFLNLRDNPKEI